MTQSLQDLLSSLAVETELKKIVTEKLYIDDVGYCNRIVQGTLAEEFLKYLYQNSEKTEKNIEKFLFLLLIEVVLGCKNKNEQSEVFNHLVSIFFDENGKYKNCIKFSNQKLAGKIFSYSRKNGKDVLEDDAIKYLKKAKYSLNIWEGDKGLVPIYMEFSHTFSQKSNICACLLSIL